MTIRMKWILMIATALLMGCEPREDGAYGDGGYDGSDAASGSEDSSSREGEEGRYGTQADIDRAKALWNEMQEYQSWPTLAGESGWEEGSSGHGAFIRYHANSTARETTDRPSSGAIIVKENYSAKDESRLEALTVMMKTDGYAPEYGDWFWVKYNPEGKVMKSKDGHALAGRVEDESGGGCISCHANAGGGDYLYAND